MVSVVSNQSINQHRFLWLAPYVVNNLSQTWLAVIILIHVVAVSNPCCLSYESSGLMCVTINHVDIVQVYHMMLTAHMILDFRFVANACRPVFSALMNARIILSTSLLNSFTLYAKRCFSFCT